MRSASKSWSMAWRTCGSGAAPFRNGSSCPATTAATNGMPRTPICCM
ncbi:hypothetical protein ACFQY7_30405 [Actinomadura luteofluorescens]